MQQQQKVHLPTMRFCTIQQTACPCCGQAVFLILLTGPHRKLSRALPVDFEQATRSRVRLAEMWA